MVCLITAPGLTEQDKHGLENTIVKTRESLIAESEEKSHILKYNLNGMSGLRPFVKVIPVVHYVHV